MPNKNRFTQENSTTMVVKPEIVPLMTAREAALDRSRDMLESATPYDNYMEAKDFGIIGKLRSQIGSKLINKGASNCTLSATNCYGDTYGTARSIVSGKTRFKEIPVDSIQPGDLVIQSLPGVPDGTENKYHTMIYDHKAPWTYVDEEGDLIREGDMLFNYSRGKKSKGQYVQKAKSFTDKNEGKTHYRYYRLVPENKLGNKIRFHQKGGKAYYIKSLDNFIKNNSKLYGINTKDFRDFFIELVGLESSYNSKTTNSKGNYGGWYATKGGANLSEYDQHKAAFQHLAKLFKENITDLDLTTAKDKGITQAQLLAKYWNQGNRVTNYIHNNIDDSDGLGTKISEYGNNINVNMDYSRYTPEAITNPFVIVEDNKTLPNAITLTRNPYINFSNRENSIVNLNKSVYESKSKKFDPSKVQVGDTIWLIDPRLPNPPKELIPQQLKLKSGGIVKRFN